MIDFIKAISSIELPDVDEYSRITGLNFKSTFDRTSGEINSKHIHHGREFEAYYLHSKRLLIKGSIHKSSRQGSNYDDFTANEVSESLTSLCNILGINPKQMKLQNLEVGVNIRTDFDPEKILMNLICYKRKPFEIFSNDPFFGKKAILNQYEIKIYDKGKQFNLENNTLRYELKVRKMRQISNTGIVYLSDLQEKSKLKLLKSHLIKSIDHLIFSCDNIDSSRISDKQKSLILKAQNYKYWKNLESSVYKREKKKYEEAINKTQGINFKRFIKKEVSNKFDSLLLDESPGTCPNFTL